MNFIYFALPVALLTLSVVFSIVLVKRGTPAKKAMLIHFVTLILISVICFALPVSAETAAAADTATAAATTTTSADGWRYIGAAIAVGVACIGGGIAVAAGAPAAIGANAEDPKTFGKSIIFVALGEGFGLYGVLIAVLILVL